MGRMQEYPCIHQLGGKTKCLSSFRKLRNWEYSLRHGKLMKSTNRHGEKSLNKTILSISSHNLAVVSDNLKFYFFLLTLQYAQLLTLLWNLKETFIRLLKTQNRRSGRTPVLFKCSSTSQQHSWSFTLFLHVMYYVLNSYDRILLII